MQANKLQYELECVQRPGAEILIDGVPLAAIRFDFDPASNTTNIVTKEVAIEEPELETPEEDLHETEEPKKDIEIELPPPVEISTGDSNSTTSEIKSDGNFSSVFVPPVS